jgi:hypothetical protein
MSLFPSRQPADDTTLADRRRGSRRPCVSDRMSRVSPAGVDGPTGNAVVTCIVDYSMHGLGLIHPAEIQPGEKFYVETEGRPGQSGNRRLLRCSRCTSMDGGRFLIGAEFIG